MYGLLDKLKNLVVYDADKEFYAKVFPDSVSRTDLLRIRRMSHQDLPEVLRIERENYQFPWDEDIFHDCFKANYDLRVCEEMDRVLGYCILSMGVGEAHILNISVAATEQNQGIGRRMLEHMIEQTRGKAETIFLEVRPTNTAALALYKKTGFNEIGIRKGYYPAENGREDAIMLALELF
ncbi:MAG: ribosomal protein S18-alanine N-acetyltransferase [Gammaproteobacteria bacterium]